MVSKKIACSVFMSIIFFVTAFSSEAAQKILTDCNIYQLGTDEFILKLNGKNFAPAAFSPEFKDNSMTIEIKDTSIKNSKEIISRAQNFLELSPSVKDFQLEELPDKILITIEANSPMEIKSLSRSVNGYTLRVKLKENPTAENFSVKLQSPRLKKKLPSNFLPFEIPGEITAEFREIPLPDALRLLMSESNKNLIIDNSFPKNIQITLSLKNAKPKEIINELMNEYDFACYTTGNNTVVFGTHSNLYKLSGQDEIKSFKISYANLESVKTVLKNFTGLQDVEINSDERLRMIHVKTNPAKLAEVADIISRMDVPARQVMIRASIFEFNDSATREVQNSLNMVYEKWQLHLSPATGFMQFSYTPDARSNIEREITSTLYALETKNKGKTIANPSVIAIDGQEASIRLKEDVLYPKGLDKEGHTEWDSVNVGPELRFTPRIEDNGFINLDININTGDYLGRDIDENIITTNREIKTKIRVRDGMPFVVGGLFQDRNIRTRAKIPILGEIPLLGALFSYISNEKSKSQAVMIVTPYILDN